MRFKLFFPAVLAVSFLLSAAVPASPQTVPEYREKGGIPLEVGAGFSDFNIDFGQGRREDGGTVSADWTLRRMPHLLHGLGIDGAGRDIVFDAPAAVSFVEYRTVGGGAIYHFPRPHNIVPYVRTGEGYGWLKFLPGYAPGTYHSDTRGYFYAGGGADFHAYHHLWIRADYEFQRWQQLFGDPGRLTPNGFTIGPEFDFGTFHGH